MASSGPTFATVYSFASAAAGEQPQSALVEGRDGNLYGTTFGGGDASCAPLINGCGTIFEVTPAGKFTSLHDFEIQEGIQPPGGLVVGNDGNLYGTTSGGGGASGSGTGSIFRYTPGGQLTPIYLLCGQATCSNNDQPSALVLGPDGNFYGTTQLGGYQICNGGCGTVFSVTPSGAFATVYSFCSLNNCTDGVGPQGGLFLGQDGNLYGVTTGGGNASCQCGTVFKITLTGVLTTLYAFTNGNDGSNPLGRPFVTSGAVLYGTTEFAGNLTCNVGLGTGCGTVFRVDPKGNFTTLYQFSGSDGGAPMAGVIEASDGNLYGTTSYGGTGCSAQYGCGTVFMISPSGAFTKLHDFASTDGAQPLGDLLQAKSGVIYGSTAYGGTGCSQTGCGTIFSLTPAGQGSGAGATSTTLSISASPSASQADAGSNITFTATVTHATSTAAPTGTVTFSSGSTVLGSGTLGSSGRATFSSSTLPANQYTVTADYGGDQNYSGSTSASVSLDVVDFQIAAAPTDIIVSSPGGSGSTTLTVTPMGGFAQTVAYSCSGLPAGARCSFASSSTGATMTISTSAQAAALLSPRDRVPVPIYACFVPGLFGMLSLGQRRRRALIKRVLCLGLMLSLATIGAGCGGGGDSSGGSGGGGGAVTGTYTVMVAATAGSLVHQLNVTLNIE